MVKSLRMKLIAIGVLGACAVGLVLLDMVLNPGDRTSSPHPDHPVLAGIIDSLFVKYGVNPNSVSTWQIHVPGRKFVRTEQKVLVAPDFISMSFNQELNSLVSDAGARAIATERTKESTVTVHIVKDRHVIHSISFVMSARK